MHVLDEHHRRTIANQLIHERHPRVVQALPRDERMQVLRGHDAEGQPKVRVIRKLADYGIRSFPFFDPKVFLEHLAHRPVGRALAVRERATDATGWSR